MTALATLTLSAGQATVTFSSISGAYRDLRLITRTTSTTASGGYMRFNGDTGSNYSAVWAYGTGASTGSSSATGTSISLFGMLNGNTNIDSYDILDYSATDKHKSLLNRYDSPQADGTYMRAGRWANTAAITSIVLGATTGTFSAGDSFTLFGVSA